MKNKKYYVIIFLIIGVSAFICGLIIYFHTHSMKKDKTLEELGPRNEVKITSTVAPTKEPDSDVTSAPTPTPTPYVSPVNFEELQNINPDIYAWLDIPDTEISYPILQSESDDAFYLKHDYQKNYSDEGSIMTEHVYNSKDFTDVVTLIYGHTMLNGNMFGTLQKTFSDKDFFDAEREVIIYLPDKELHFEVFAAVPFDGWHILYNVDFNDSRYYRAFFDELYSAKEIGAMYKEDPELEVGQQVIILSACLKGNNKRRFLVCAKLNSE